MHVAVIVGSLRKESFSRKVAKALAERAPTSLGCRFVEIGELPHYNEDLDGDPPPAWTAFRDEIRGCAAVLFVTPEYNRSIPGVLKNAVDVGSRPQGQSVWAGLPTAVVSVTPYALGAFGANQALRHTFVFLDMPAMQQPEAYIGKAGELFDAEGRLTSDGASDFFVGFMKAFETWVGRFAPAESKAFDDFMRQRTRIAEAYVNGETAPLDEIVVRSDPASFFSPRGDHQEGAAEVAARYDADARSFAPPGSSELEVLQSGASGELAFWSGLQHAEARLGGGGPQEMTLRVTEVFRFEAGGWKLAHRHADQMKG